MKNNMHTIDRIIRVLFAVIVAVLYYKGTVTGALAYVLIAVAAILLLTSLVNFCPLYSVFGISTRKNSK